MTESTGENPTPDLGEPVEQERVLAATIESLPPLQEGFARVVHLTRVGAVDAILQTGLDYEKHGMLSSTARAWSDPAEVQYTTTDLRFQGEDIRAVVMDIRFEELRRHENVQQSTGRILPERIVGVINPNEETNHDRR